MPYQKKDRPTWRADLRLEDGWWKGATLPVPATRAGRPLAVKFEQMWGELAEIHRAWDILGPVVAGDMPIGRLFDWWNEAKGDVHALRRRINDTNLAGLVDAFLVMYAKQVGAEQQKRMRRHLEYLTKTPITATQATAEELTKRLYAFDGKRNTLRVVHSSWSTFFEYARAIKKAVPTNPMLDVTRPPTEKAPLAFYELDVIERVVDWQATPMRRALFAFLYGTGVEISVALTLTRADVNPATKEVRAPGTKAHTRDRLVRVDDWAWDRFWSWAKDLLPAAELFPGVDRWKASDWHRLTIGDGEKPCHNQYRITTRDGLKLAKKIKMYAARHAWAARHLRGGAPVAVVQRQLGHATAKETLDTYGAFIPDSADRNHWQRQVAKAEKRRRNAK